MDISETALHFRARISCTPHLVSLLSVTRDCRVSRVIELLNRISPHGEVITPCAEQILQICTDDPLRCKGFHPRLLSLEHELSKATDILVESSKRILMYLDHIKATGSKLPDTIRMLTESTVREQMQLATRLYHRARSANTAALAKPPGPAPMPYDNHEDSSTAQQNPARGLLDGKPFHADEDYDIRWDPDFRMPGSPHGKFFKFPGPYFVPDTTRAIFDHFFLSETTADLIDNFNRRFADCLANLKDTGRIEPDEDIEMHEAFVEVSCFPNLLMYLN